jgi:hypothetical protein
MPQILEDPWDPDPAGDLEAFHTECLFADLEVVERIDLAGFEEQHVVFHVRQTVESG